MKKNMIASSLVFLLGIIIQPSHLFYVPCLLLMVSFSFRVVYGHEHLKRDFFMRKMGNSFKWVGKGNRNISLIWKREYYSATISLRYETKWTDTTSVAAYNLFTVVTKVQRKRVFHLILLLFPFYLRWDLGLQYVCLSVSIYLFAFLFELCLASLVCWGEYYERTNF